MLYQPRFRQTLALIGLIGTVAALSSSAHAQTSWQQSHPRRAEVNQRLANQNLRIHQEVAAGDMSQARANRLHREDHQIRQEERLMASQHGGHITRSEQRTLNQQENHVSRQIGG